MTSVQMFTKTAQNLEEYQTQMLACLDFFAQHDTILQTQSYTISTHIRSQTQYIPREDLTIAYQFIQIYMTDEKAKQFIQQIGLSEQETQGLPRLFSHISARQETADAYNARIQTQTVRDTIAKAQKADEDKTASEINRLESLLAEL